MKAIQVDSIPKDVYKRGFSLTNKKNEEECYFKLLEVKEGNWDTITSINNSDINLYSDYGIYELHAINNEYFIVLFDELKTNMEKVVEDVNTIINN